VSVGNAVLSIQKLGTFCAGLVLVLLLGAFYRYTKFGIAMRASADNSEAASLMGVNLNRVASVSWALAAMLGAIAGILVAPFLFLDVLFMKFTLIKSLCAAVMGGFTSLPGVVLGGLLVGLAENLFGGYVSTDFKNAFVFSLILIVLFLRPQGIMRRTQVIKV
jgi:branched-chain amino acid transport system permease protein